MESTDASIMIDARYVCDHTSGIGRYTENMIQELLKLDDSLRLRLICDPSRPTANLDANDDVVKDRVTFQQYAPEPNSLRTRYQLVNRIDFNDVDLFHSPFNILPSGLKVPAMFTLHDIMWLLDASYCTDSLWRKVITGNFYKALIPRSVEDSTRIMTVSQTSADEIEDYFPEMRGKVHVSYNGVDPYFSPVEEESGWDEISSIVEKGTPFTLVVGQGSPYKNHGRAVAAFIEAFHDEPDMHFVIVRRLSRGPAKEFHEHMADPRIAGRVHHLEHVTGDQLKALYTLAKIFLFPSLYEGFGLPALEAMACGTPVVTSNVGAPNEIGGDAAVKVDPMSVASIAEGLRKLYDDAEFYEDRRKAGIERAAEFTWARCAEANHRIYREILAETGVI